MSQRESSEAAALPEGVPDVEDFFWAVLFVLGNHAQLRDSDAFDTAFSVIEQEWKFRNRILRRNTRDWDARVLKISSYMGSKMQTLKSLQVAVDRHHMGTLMTFIRQPGVALNAMLEFRSSQDNPGGR